MEWLPTHAWRVANLDPDVSLPASPEIDASIASRDQDTQDPFTPLKDVNGRRLTIAGAAEPERKPKAPFRFRARKREF